MKWERFYGRGFVGKAIAVPESAYIDVEYLKEGMGTQ